MSLNWATTAWNMFLDEWYPVKLPWMVSSESSPIIPGLTCCCHILNVIFPSPPLLAATSQHILTLKCQVQKLFYRLLPFSTWEIIWGITFHSTPSTEGVESTPMLITRFAPFAPLPPFAPFAPFVLLVHFAPFAPIQTLRSFRLLPFPSSRTKFNGVKCVQANLNFFVFNRNPKIFLCSIGISIISGKLQPIQFILFQHLKEGFGSVCLCVCMSLCTVVFLYITTFF